MVIVAILVLVGIAARNIEIITFEHFGIGYTLSVIISNCGNYSFDLYFNEDKKSVI